MALQARNLLNRLRERDRVRELHAPVLEQFCLRGCMMDKNEIASLNALHPAVLSHTKISTALRSSTWVGGSGTDCMI